MTKEIWFPLVIKHCRCPLLTCTHQSFYCYLNERFFILYEEIQIPLPFKNSAAKCTCRTVNVVQAPMICYNCMGDTHKSKMHLELCPNYKFNNLGANYKSNDCCATVNQLE